MDLFVFYQILQKVGVMFSSLTLENLRMQRIQAPEKNKGFSLIELMIVLSIVAILAAIGNASYQSQVQRGIRADAQRAMLEIASKQEQYMMNNQNYAMTIGAGGLNYSLGDTVDENYVITMDVQNGTTPATFTITAIAQGQMVDDGTLKLQSNGIKIPADKWK